MTHKIHFSKYHGLGNDFILVDGISQRLDEIDLNQLAQTVCNRHFGIGADGLIVGLPSDECDFQMKIINSDGTEPEMCGNGIRCFAHFLRDENITDKEVLSVDTKAGKIIPAIVSDTGHVESIEVDMGEPILHRAKIPIVGDGPEPVIAESIQVDGQSFQFTGVSMGNPHAVVFSDDVKQLDIATLGPLFESHSLFPEKINTEFVQVINRNEAVMIVWERGAGETLACGTGACATVVAGVLNNVLDRKAVVHLPGGDLNIEWQESDNHIIMTGPSEWVFRGVIEVA